MRTALGMKRNKWRSNGAGVLWQIVKMREELGAANEATSIKAWWRRG